MGKRQAGMQPGIPQWPVRRVHGVRTTAPAGELQSSVLTRAHRMHACGNVQPARRFSMAQECAFCTCMDTPAAIRNAKRSHASGLESPPDHLPGRISTGSRDGLLGCTGTCCAASNDPCTLAGQGQTDKRRRFRLCTAHSETACSSSL